MKLKRRFLSRFAAGVVSASLALAVATPEATRGQVTAQPPLTNETLVALVTGDPFDAIDVGTMTVTADCFGGPNSQAIISYTASGPAFGPYPGTYQESGTATLTYSGTFQRPLESFSAEFTINSPVGLVTGTKGMEFHPASVGTCEGVTSPTGQSQMIHSLAVFFTTYEATITTPDGSCTVSGTANVTLLERDFFFPDNPRLDRQEFTEVFRDSTPCVVVASDRDDCRDGGWETAVREGGSGFKNQGDCMQYLNTDK